MSIIRLMDRLALQQFPDQESADRALAEASFDEYAAAYRKNSFNGMAPPRGSIGLSLRPRPQVRCLHGLLRCHRCNHYSL